MLFKICWRCCWKAPLTPNFGDHKAVARPDPIPNSAVKHSLANGSGCIASARVGCRQIFPKAETKVSAFSLTKNSTSFLFNPAFFCRNVFLFPCLQIPLLIPLSETLYISRLGYRNIRKNFTLVYFSSNRRLLEL